MIILDNVKKVEVIKLKIKDLENECFNLERQKREFGNFIETYKNKNKKSFKSEIDRLSRYLINIDIKLKANQKKIKDLQTELHKSELV